MPSAPYWEVRSVRDPLYGFVGLTNRESKILETFALQRLARIKQLAHTFIVYPSAVHTRLEHSLGAMNIAGRMCDLLSLPKAAKEAARLTALLHDVGHGPFSHPFEEVMRFVNGPNFSHEDVSKLIIEYDSSTTHALGKMKSDVLEIMTNDSLLSEIISSSLDADKLDYLRRDSYHTGVAYGIFDLERVLRTICRIREPDRDYIAIEEKGMDALESYRLARYSMHSQVYEHHTRLIADDMFLRAVIASIKEGDFPREYFDMNNPDEFLPKYLEMDDHSVEHYIIQNAKGAPVDLVKSLRARSLLKRAYVLPLTKEGVSDPRKRERLISMNRNEVTSKEELIAREAGLEPEYVIIHLQSINIKLYERFEEALRSKEKPILIRKRDGRIASLDEESPISTSMNPIRRLFVFCPRECAGEVRRISEEIFKERSIF